MADPKKIEFRITRGGKATQMLFTIWIRDPLMGKWIAARKDIPIQFQRDLKTWRIAVFGRALRGQPFEFSFDNLRILEKAR